MWARRAWPSWPSKSRQTESKDEVLCNYMNTIYLGRNSYGIQAAAKAYFNKDAKDLTLSEAAMIARHYSVTVHVGSGR